MRPVVLATAFLILAGTAALAADETLHVSGQAGVLGEWELTATATATTIDKQYSGPLVMKHVGLCSVDGPEEKKGEIRLQLVSSSRVRVSLLIDGATCTYDGRKTESYNGLLRCPERRDVPLVLWLK